MRPTDARPVHAASGSGHALTTHHVVCVGARSALDWTIARSLRGVHLRDAVATFEGLDIDLAAFSLRVERCWAASCWRGRASLNASLKDGLGPGRPGPKPSPC